MSGLRSQQLLPIILELQTKRQLEILRLVCILFDAAKVPFHFDFIFRLLRNADLELAKMIAARFGYVSRKSSLALLHEQLVDGLPLQTPKI
jgi:hypothetical protein